MKGTSMLLALALLGGAMTPAQGVQITEILYEDREPAEPPYTSRLLVEGKRMRIDFGRDDDDFILFDGEAVYQVSHKAGRIIVIPAGRNAHAVRKELDARVKTGARGGQRVFSVMARDTVCMEFRSAPLLDQEMLVLQAFRKSLAANQGTAWEHTPEDVRDPCDWVTDTELAGEEYRHGLPLYIRYANGRGRAYKGHARREAPDSLFQLPIGYERISIVIHEDTGLPPGPK